MNKISEKIDLQFLVAKITEEIPDPSNSKEYYNSYLKRKNKKSEKRSKITTEQLKAIESQNIVDLKSVNIEHPKTSHRFFKAVRQAEKVFQLGFG